MLGKCGDSATVAPMQYRALGEAKWIFGTLAVALLATFLTLPFLSIVLGAMILFTIYFFRDPERIPPPDDNLAVAPADGLVTTVDEVEETEFLKTKVRRIGIFLSVLDVHVNRAPLIGEVTHSVPKPGRFLDARDPDASLFNQSRSWVFEGPAGAVMVKQITGAIARRICPWAVVGDKLKRGERFGMIRFGSRTEVFLPMDAEVLVKLGDRVRGGETAVARMKKP